MFVRTVSPFIIDHLTYKYREFATMSLPLGHPLENATSLDRVLEDLIVRFIINCPPEDFSSVERELFHVEEASWFYTDFVTLMNPNLPNMRIKSFAQHVIKLCPLVWKWDVKADQALKKFSQYKKSIPVRGAAIFNKSLTKLLLVKGTESDSWSFPRGKISKDEDDVDCCIREVQEEIGFDLTDYIDEDQFIERNIQGKNYKIFLVSGVPEDFDFKPKVRNEIEKIEWRDFRKLSRSIHKTNVKYYLVNAMIRPMTLWVKRQKGNKDEDQLKAHVEEQLKLLLGIKKEETADPGRELLNMLQNAVSKPDEPAQQETQPQAPPPLQPPPMSSGPFMVPPPQFHQQFPFMGFQPFAPFPFHNGLSAPPGVAPPSSSGTQMVETQAPPTPSLNVFAKPTVAEEEEKSSAAPSKVLLDLLNQKNEQKQSQEKPKIKLLKRGEVLENQTTTNNTEQDSQTINDNKSNASALLDVLRRPSKSAQERDTELSGKTQSIPEPYQSINHNLKSDDFNNSILSSSTEESSTNVDEYEDFESSSSEEEGDQLEEEENAEEVEEAIEQDEEHKLEQLEKTEKSSGVENQEALKQNFFTTGSVPHVDARNVSDLSTGGVADLKSIKSQAKPKIKILKRGETLKDIAFESQNPSEASAAENEPAFSHQQDSKELLNMLKKSQMLAMEEVQQSLEKARLLNAPEPSRQTNISILSEPNHQSVAFETSISPQTSHATPLAGGYSTNEGNIDKKTSDSADLLSLLKRPSSSHQKSTEGQIHTIDNSNEIKEETEKGSKELLSLLKNPGVNKKINLERNATTITNIERSKLTESSARELMGVVNNGNVHDNASHVSPLTSPAYSSYNSPSDPSYSLHQPIKAQMLNGPGTNSNTAASHSLLQMLKQPRAPESNNYSVPSHENRETYNSTQAIDSPSNELLSLLQKK